jgi:hypothetical protein
MDNKEYKVKPICKKGITQKEAKKITKQGLLKGVLDNYTYKEMKKEAELKRIYTSTLDLLYNICNVGRICMFNNITISSRNNPGNFSKSISTLSELANQIDELSKDNKLPYGYVVEQIYSVVTNRSEIHTVGYNLVLFFLKIFKILGVSYDSTKTKLLFRKTGGLIYMISYNHRFTFKPQTEPFKNLTMYISDKMITKDGKEKSNLFKNVCPYDPYMVTIDTVDEWKDLPDWRKIKFRDNGCFDLLFLIKTITNNLNENRHTNPFPIFPNNPFTRKDFTIEDLKIIKQSIIDNFISVSPGLITFLDTDSLWTNDSDWQLNLLYLYKTNLRYMLIPTVIDENEFPTCVGLWAAKSSKTLQVEKLIRLFLDTNDLKYLSDLKGHTLPNMADNKFYFHIPEWTVEFALPLEIT